jgi:membrane fusion protein, multidrug efflux system
LIIAVSVVIVAVTARSEQEDQGSSAGEARPQGQGHGMRRSGGGAVPVIVEAVKHADVPVYLDGLGTIRALNTAVVRPRVDGLMTKVLFHEGQDVEEGYVLAELDSRTYQAQLDQATAKLAQDQAQLANAKLDLERYERLAATNAGSKQQADTQKAMVAQFEALVKADQAAIDNAQTYLDYTKVTAPFAGRTGLRQVDVGNLVHASDSQGIVVITQLKPISMLFNIPQQQLQQINDGLAQGPLAVDALSSDGSTVIDQGRLTVVDNQIDQSTGTVRMKAEFPNNELKLWPGEFVNVRLRIQTLKQAMIVPTGAVQRGPNGAFVYLLVDDKSVSMRPVTVGVQDEIETVVINGLSEGDRVVTTGFTRLADGSEVSVQSETGTQSGSGTPQIEHKDIRPTNEGGEHHHHRHADSDGGGQ